MGGLIKRFVKKRGSLQKMHRNRLRFVLSVMLNKTMQNEMWRAALLVHDFTKFICTKKENIDKLKLKIKRYVAVRKL